MTKYNLYTLLHRHYQWTTILPDGRTLSGNSSRDIPICIPKIQRDYAEGRDTEMIERKRRNLLNDMLDVVYGFKTDLSFDFVYGYMIDNGKILDKNSWQDKPNAVFEPLDGQQRLTTLFLLYWLFGREQDLRSDNHSLLIYRTRDTSEEFCHWLVNQEATKTIKDWLSLTKEIKVKNDENKKKWNHERNSKGIVDPIANRLRFPIVPIPSLFQFLQTMESFKWDWHDDPNIYSMIRVIESTIHYIHERGLKYSRGISCNANLDKISFMLLDDLFCDGDQLFEKMNARGKALTSFEILKSSFEEEMEQQNLPTNNLKLTNDWRKAIDGDWIDYCWDNSNIGNHPDLKTIQKVEIKLEKLLIRLVGKSFFTKDIVGTPTNGIDAIDYAALLTDSISKRESVNKVIDYYIEYARHERSVGNNKFTQIDFEEIYEDFQNLIYKDQTGWHDASCILPQLNRSNTQTLLDEFMVDSPTHNTRVMVYAMFAYLHIVPAKNLVNNSIEKENFKDWMRFIRNMYNSDNKNSGLDNFADVKAAIKAIDHWLESYKSLYRTNNKQDILRLILFIKKNAFSQEQAILDEEAIKADLRINGTKNATAKEWENSLLKAENNYYLWGQIIAPLSWSYTDSFYDIALFNKYTNCLEQIFNPPLENQPIDALLIQTMLCYKDYRHNLNDNLGSLGKLNNNRDYSWKQYLRKKDLVYYGYLFKLIIDDWLLPTNASLSFEDFLRKEISSKKRKIGKTDWRYFIVNIYDPHTLLQLFGDILPHGRYVYTEPNGHTYYFRSDTFRTYNRYEILTTYLRYETRLLQNKVKVSCLAHTADDIGAHIDFTMPNNDIIRLSLGDKNLYNISIQSFGTNITKLLYQNIDVSKVEVELKNIGVIQSL